MSKSNFVLNIFNKNKITLDDVKEFFSVPQEETSVLEFKSGDIEIEDIYKEITAFLNTEGGLLIIGTPREKRKSYNKKHTISYCEGELTYSKFRNKDWLYQKIASNVTPTPVNINIEEFITEEGAIFLIDVPQSSSPPHQCSADGKYYIRLEREAKPAPHGIVQALFDKRRKPKLYAEISIKSNINFTDEVHIRIKNSTVVPADKVSFMIDVYGIKYIDSDFNFILVEDYVGKRYSMTDNAKTVLVQSISIPIHFYLQRYVSEYLIMVGYWSKELNFESEYFIYDPKQEKIIKKGSSISEDILLDDIKKIIKKIDPN